MNKRKIKRHKGDRSSDLHIRINPELHEQLKAICKQRGISQADWIEDRITEASANIGAKEKE